MLKFNLHKPLSLLEQKKNRRYNYAEIADVCGLTRQGVRRLLKEESDTLKVSTLSALVDFFDKQGMPITIGDLFVDEEGDQSSANPTSTPPDSSTLA